MISGEAKVLVVEDEPDFRNLVAHELGEEGYGVSVACDGLAALTCLAETEYDVVVTDVRMPGASGLAVLDALGAARPPFIVMTAAGDEAVRGEARRLGAIGLLDKPFLPAELSLLLEDMLPG